MLVTGATGNVGRAVVRTLLDAGVAVRALVTAPDAARAQFGLPSPLLTTVSFDFENPDTYAAAFAEGTALFLMRPPAIGDAGVITRAVDVAFQSGVRRIAFLSVQGADQNPLVPHHAIEVHLQALATAQPMFHFTLLRAAFFMQNLSGTHAADIRELCEILVPAGNGRTAFVDARDVGAAAALVLTEDAPAPSGNRAYELTGLHAFTYHEVAEILSRACGHPIRYRHPGLLRFYRAMRRRGHTRAYVAVMMALYTTARLGFAAHLSSDLEMLLGRPPHTLEQFVIDNVAAFLPSQSEHDVEPAAAV